MEQNPHEERGYPKGKKPLRNKDIIRIRSQSFNYYISAAAKTLNYFNIKQKSVTFMDAALKVEKRFTISSMDNQSSDSLQVNLTPDKGPFTCVMSFFEVLKCSKEGPRAFNAGSTAQEGVEKEIIRPGDPVLLRNVMNGLYLSIKHRYPSRVILEPLDSEESDFVFIFENFDLEGIQTVLFGGSYKIRSLNGGIVALKLEDQYTFESFNGVEERKEREDDELQIDLEEKLERIVNFEEGLETQVLENTFMDKINKVLIFQIEPAQTFEIQMLKVLCKLFSRVINFYQYFESWGHMLGKDFKLGSREQIGKFHVVEDGIYYAYEEANLKQSELVHQAARLSRILGSTRDLLTRYNYLSDLRTGIAPEDPCMVHRIKQTAMRDANLFFFLTHLLKLLISKIFRSLRIPTVFGYKYDTETQHRHSSRLSEELKRVAIPGKLEWEKVKTTPQFIARHCLRRSLSMLLEIIYYGIVACPENVELVSRYTTDFYYLMSFEKELCFQILLEIAKYKKYSSENHVIDWINKLEVIGERSDNLTNQIRYLWILRQLCVDNGMNKDLRRIQKKIRIQLFNIGTNPQKRGVLNFSYSPETVESNVVLFKPKKLSLKRIELDSKDLEKLGLRQSGDYKLIWDFLGTQNSRVTICKTMVRYITAYFDLMTEMSEKRNDESLNQVKNLGMTRPFCEEMILNKDCPLKIKNSAFKMYMKAHMNAKKLLSTFDNLSYCYEQLDKVSLVDHSLFWMNLNEIRAPEFQGGHENYIMYRLLHGEALPSVEKVRLDCKNDFLNAGDYLEVFKSVLEFVVLVIDFGGTAHADNIFILGVVHKVFLAVFPVGNYDSVPTWYTIALVSAREGGAFELKVKQVIERSLDILDLISKIRLNLQILAYLQCFKAQFRENRKFSPRTKLLDRIMNFYSFGESQELVDNEQVVRPRPSGKISKVAPKQSSDRTIPISSTSAVALKERVPLEEQIKRLASEGQSFVKLLYVLYGETSVARKLHKIDRQLEIFVQNQKIKKKTFKILEFYFKRESLFSSHLQKLQLFVGQEQFRIIKDFDGDLQAYKIQIVSINRLQDQIEQILIDDETMRNHLKSIGNNNYKLRILELTNILIQILGRLIERLANPSLFLKTQNYMRVLGFEKILTNIFKVSYNPERHQVMLTKTVQFLEFFSLNNSTNKYALVPFAHIFLNLISERLRVSRLLCHILSEVRSPEFRQNIIVSLFNKLSGLNIDFEDLVGRGKRKNSVEYREVYTEHLKLIINLVMCGNRFDPRNQVWVMKSLLEDPTLSYFITDENVMLLTRPELLKKEGQSLRDLIETIYSLAAVLVARNSSNAIMLSRTLSEEALLIVIQSRDLDFRTRVRLMRVYSEIYIIPDFLLEDTQSVENDNYFKLLDFIHDEILIHFVDHLEDLANFGSLSLEKPSQKKKMTHFLQTLTEGEFTITNTNEKAPHPGLEGFWWGMASGEPWNFTYDGVLLILVDLFQISSQWDLSKHNDYSQKMKNIHLRLQNILYTTIRMKDHFKLDIELNGLIFILQFLYTRMLVDLEEEAEDEEVFPPYFRFELADHSGLIEFILSKETLLDKSSLKLRAKLEGNEPLDPRISKSDLEVSDLQEVMRDCFYKYFEDNNLQIYEVINLFTENSMFSVCLKLWTIFSPYGITFRQSMAFVDSLDYDRVNSSPVNLSRYIYKLMKLLKPVEKFGKKQNLRNERKKQLDVCLNYIDNHSGQDLLPEYFEDDSEEVQQRGKNPESIFGEFEAMRAFIFNQCSPDDGSSCQLRNLVTNVLKPFKVMQGGGVFNVNRFEMLAAMGQNYFKQEKNDQKLTLELLQYYNCIFQMVSGFGPQNEIHAHFSNFIQNLIDKELPKLLFNWLETSKSSKVLNESLVLITNFYRHSEKFRLLFHERYFDLSDTLYHVAKLIFGKPLLLAIYKVIRRDTREETSWISAINFLYLIELIFQNQKLGPLMYASNSNGCSNFYSTSPNRPNKTRGAARSKGGLHQATRVGNTNQDEDSQSKGNHSQFQHFKSYYSASRSGNRAPRNGVYSQSANKTSKKKESKFQKSGKKNNLKSHQSQNEDTSLYTGQKLSSKGKSSSTENRKNQGNLSMGEKIHSQDHPSYITPAQSGGEIKSEKKQYRKIKPQIQKMAFLLMKRFCSFFEILESQFPLEDGHIYVVEIAYWISRALVSLMQINVDFLQLREGHLLFSILASVFDKELNLSSNLEDEKYCRLYHNCVRLLDIMVCNLSEENVRILVSDLKVASLMNTMAIIYKKKILPYESSGFSTNFCSFENNRCSYYTCSLRKVSRHVKDLQNLGFDIFIILMKLQLFLEDSPLLEEFRDHKIQVSQIRQLEAEIRDIIKDQPDSYEDTNLEEGENDNSDQREGEGEENQVHAHLRKNTGSESGVAGGYGEVHVQQNPIQQWKMSEGSPIGGGRDINGLLVGHSQGEEPKGMNFGDNSSLEGLNRRDRGDFNQTASPIGGLIPGLQDHGPINANNFIKRPYSQPYSPQKKREIQRPPYLDLNLSSQQNNQSDLQSKKSINENLQINKQGSEAYQLETERFDDEIYFNAQNRNNKQTKNDGLSNHEHYQDQGTGYNRGAFQEPELSYSPQRTENDIEAEDTFPLRARELDEEDTNQNLGTRGFSQYINKDKSVGGRGFNSDDEDMGESISHTSQSLRSGKEEYDYFGSNNKEEDMADGNQNGQLDNQSESEDDYQNNRDRRIEEKLKNRQNFQIRAKISKEEDVGRLSLNSQSSNSDKIFEQTGEDKEQLGDKKNDPSFHPVKPPPKLASPNFRNLQNFGIYPTNLEQEVIESQNQSKIELSQGFEKSTPIEIPIIMKKAQLDHIVDLESMNSLQSIEEGNIGSFPVQEEVHAQQLHEFGAVSAPLMPSYTLRQLEIQNKRRESIKQANELIQSKIRALRALFVKFYLSQAYNHYFKRVSYIQLTFSNLVMDDSPINFIRNSIFFRVSESCFYFDRETEKRLKRRLISEPNTTRKIMLLSNINLLVANLKARQKIYSSRLFSFLLRFVPFLKKIALFLVLLINFLILAFMDSDNKNLYHMQPLLSVSYINYGLALVLAILLFAAFLERHYMADIKVQKLRMKMVEARDRYSKYVSVRNQLVHTRSNQLYRAWTIFCLMIGFLKVAFLRYLNSFFNKEVATLALLLISSLMQVAYRPAFQCHYFNLSVMILRTDAIQSTRKALGVNVRGIISFGLLLATLIIIIGVWLLASNPELHLQPNITEGLGRGLLSVAYSGLISRGGLHSLISAQSIEDSPKYYIFQIYDILFDVLLKRGVLWLVLVLVVVQLRVFRDRQQQNERRLDDECVVCGVSKSFLEMNGFNWRKHIQHEHNFRRLTWYFLRLLDQEREDQSIVENNFKVKVLSCDESLFLDLQVDKLISLIPNYAYRSPQSGTNPCTGCCPPKALSTPAYLIPQIINVCN